MGRGAWEGDWIARLEQATESLGFSSPWDLAIQFPAISYRDLAISLEANLVALQVEQYLRAEAIRRGEFNFFARDCLVRKIRQHNIKGWKSGPRPDFEVARSYGAWCGALGDEFLSQAREVWGAINRDPELKVGWLPEGPHDPIILRAFSGTNFDISNRE